MNLQSVARLSAILLLLLVHPVRADTASTSTPSRGDAIAKGDRIILNTDAPIFQLDSNAADKNKQTKACAPWRSQIEIETAPKTTTTTEGQSQSGGAPPATKTTVNGAVTVTESTAAAAGDTIKTTSATIATARIVRVGPSKLRRAVDRVFGIEGAPYEVPSDTDSKTMVPGCRKVPADMNPTVLKDTTYSFTPNDLDGYSTDRFGLTYGVVVVPNKVIISSRSFISSSSVFPYVGYEAWGPGFAGALVFAAGVGTAPASTQASSTGQSVGGAFKVGLLVGVDTQGRNSGFQYQGKPWVGISLGAGTQ
jgi:hypothetical protein